MKIAIVGAGKLGRNVATALLGGDHSVTLIDTNEELLEKFLGNESFFGEDLRRIKGIKERMLRYMDEIETRGMKEALISFL